MTRRTVHSSTNRASSNDQLLVATPSPPAKRPPSPLAVLPLHMIVRSLLATTVSSSPALLPSSLWITSALARATNPLLDRDRNPLLRLVLKSTFYTQFCAGEASAEVRRTIDGLKDIKAAKGPGRRDVQVSRLEVDW